MKMINLEKQIINNIQFRDDNIETSKSLGIGDWRLLGAGDLFFSN